MPELSQIVHALLIGYLSGSVPFGLLLTRLVRKIDIRTIGSGNIGATNVLRTGSRRLAAGVLVLDAAKGAAVVLALTWMDWPTDLVAVAGYSALLGHLFPVWLRLQDSRKLAATAIVLVALLLVLWLLGSGWHGPYWLTLLASVMTALLSVFAWGGKGVATALGLLAAWAWPVGLMVALTWLTAAFLTRRSSLGALTAMISGPIWALGMGAAGAFTFTLLIAVPVIVRHEGNIRRLLRGEEPTIDLTPNVQS